jgi:hypothetical protein
MLSPSPLLWLSREPISSRALLTRTEGVRIALPPASIGMKAMLSSDLRVAMGIEDEALEKTMMRKLESVTRAGFCLHSSLAVRKLARCQVSLRSQVKSEA